MPRSVTDSGDPEVRSHGADNKISIGLDELGYTVKLGQIQHGRRQILQSERDPGSGRNPLPFKCERNGRGIHFGDVRKIQNMCTLLDLKGHLRTNIWHRCQGKSATNPQYFAVTANHDLALESG